MTAPSEALLARLDRAITEREAIARGALPFGDAFVGSDACVYGTGDGGPYLQVVVPGFEGQAEAATKHFALYGPESVLRQCSFERTLLKLHGGNMHSCPATDETDYLDEWTHFGFDDVCPVIQGLASSYGWTAAQTQPTEGDQVT